MSAPLRSLNVVRSVSAPVFFRDAAAAADTLATLDIAFAPFGTWYEINSWFEGDFMESVQRGAFAKTISERGPGGFKVLFNHGHGAIPGRQVLGVPTAVVESKASPIGTVPLFDTSYNRDLLPGLRAGAYGSSFMFEVLAHNWVDEPGTSDHNPKGIPERTITEVRLHEFGPVTWPANPSATATVLSQTDEWYAELAKRDARSVTELRSSIERSRTLTQPPAADAPESDGSAALTDHDRAGTSTRSGITPAQRRAELIRLRERTYS